MATSAPMTLHIDLSGTFGVVFWAFVVSTVLFGVSIVQGYFYFMHSKDARNLRLFVAFMLILDFTTTALSAQSLHEYLIIHFGDPAALLYMTKPYISEYIITGVVTLGSQLFYASRIHIADKKSGRYGIPLIICMLAVAAFGFAIGAFYEIFSFGRLIAGLEGKTMMILTSFNTGLSALCDTLATCAMCVFLASQKSEYKQTKTIISVLLFISINRGVLVAIAQLGFMTSYLAAPSKIYWMPFHLSISKLHVNTLLAMLNSRLSLRAKSEETQVRFSNDLTSFNTQIGRDLPRSPSAKGSLRLSGMAYPLTSISKALERSPTSPITPSSKYTSDSKSYDDRSAMPTFTHHNPDRDDASSEV